MSDRKSPIDQALELFVYAPIGLALTAAEELPKLVEKGREQVAGRTAMYRMIGKFAVNEGQQRAGQFFKSRTQPAPPPNPPRPPAPTAPVSTPPAAQHQPQAATGPETAPVVTEALSEPNGNGMRPPAPASDDLAIPGYDSLSASQVVQRLAGLSADELEMVRAYESATRGRKTILSRVAQLQSGG